MKRLDLDQQPAQKGDLAQVVEAEQAGAQAVVDVVGVVGDVVGQRRALRLRLRRKAPDQVEILCRTQ